MPSPFPGMDPFLESQEWEDFHAKLNVVVSDTLSLRLAPRYVVRVERRVYVEHHRDDPASVRRTDFALLWTGDTGGGTAVAGGAATRVEPFECELPMPEERREAYLIIRLRETMEVVTVLETPSPSNKRPGSDGRREFLEKRQAVLQSQAHLVEFDLLRGGLRLPTATPVPQADYYAVVSRRERRPRAGVYAWTVRDPLPTISVPLKMGDPDVPLDLQAAFTTVYDRARYDLSLDYDAELQPPLTDENAEWVRGRLSSTRQRPG